MLYQFPKTLWPLKKVAKTDKSYAATTVLRTNNLFYVSTHYTNYANYEPLLRALRSLTNINNIDIWCN